MADQEKCPTCGKENCYYPNGYGCQVRQNADLTSRDLSLVKAGTEIGELKAGCAARDEVREPVRWFAAEMERKLKANDHKGGWSGMDELGLLDRLRAETAELGLALLSPRRMESMNVKEANKRIRNEAADVANFAMMIADNCRPPSQNGGGDDE